MERPRFRLEEPVDFWASSRERLQSCAGSAKQVGSAWRDLIGSELARYRSRLGANLKLISFLADASQSAIKGRRAAGWRNFTPFVSPN